jgi:hypothetical protein
MFEVLAITNHICEFKFNDAFFNNNLRSVLENQASLLLARFYKRSRFYSTLGEKSDSGNGFKDPGKDFFSLFIGFVDGDGYIDIGEHKQYTKKTRLLTKSTIRIAMGIGLDVRDLSVLEIFQEKLGVGLIRPIPNTKKYRYLISRTDLVKVIIPLMDKHSVHFLNYNRSMQFSLAKHIIDKNIRHWNDLDKNKVIPLFRPTNYIDYSELPQFSNWLIGFTMAEGSFGMKCNGSAFYSIRQTGLFNLPLIQAIQFILLGELKSEIKPDNQNSYQIAMTSRANIQKIIDFFSFSNHHPLLGYKFVQYQKFISYLKISKRYSKLNLPLF